MRRSRTCLTLLLALLAAVPARAEPRLLSAAVRVEPLSSTTAQVHAEYTIAEPDGIEWLLAWFPGQNVSELAGQVNDRPVTVTTGPAPGRAQRRMRAIPDGPAPSAGEPAAARVVLEYRVSLPPAYAHRVPLPVPLAPPSGDDTAVRVVVAVPEGATPLGNHFPRMRLESGGGGIRRLHGELAAVPAFLHARLDGLGTTGPPSTASEASPDTGASPRGGPERSATPGGFGWNFWGFFVFATIWCAGYFAWALAINRREARDG